MTHEFSWERVGDDLCVEFQFSGFTEPCDYSTMFSIAKLLTLEDKERLVTDSIEHFRRQALGEDPIPFPYDAVADYFEANRRQIRACFSSAIHQALQQKPDPKPQKVVRDTETGEFTTKEEAKADPKGTVTEIIQRERYEGSWETEPTPEQKKEIARKKPAKKKK